MRATTKKTLWCRQPRRSTETACQGAMRPRRGCTGRSGWTSQTRYGKVLSGVVHRITDIELNLFVFIYFSQWHSFLCLWCSLIYDGLHLRAVFRTTMSDVGLPDFKSTIISFSGKLKLPKWKTGKMFLMTQIGQRVVTYPRRREFSAWRRIRWMSFQPKTRTHKITFHQLILQRN